MKKLLITAFVFLFAVVFIAAKETPKAPKEEGKPAPEEGIKGGPDREQMRKDFKEMKALVDTYKAAKTDKEKADAAAAVKAKVAANYDRHLNFMLERVQKSKEKLASVEKKLQEGKKPEVKAQKIEEITQKILSGERPMAFEPPQDGKGGPMAMRGGKEGFARGERKGREKFKGPRGDDDEDSELPPPPPGDEPEDLPEAQ